MKPCRICGEVKPLDEFHRLTKSKDGRQARCKECAKRITRENYHANREERLEYMAARRARPEFRAYMIEYLRDYYRGNKDKWEERAASLTPEQIAERNRKQRERINTPEGKAKKKALDQAYYDKTRDARLAYRKARSARLRAERDERFLANEAMNRMRRRARLKKADVRRITPRDWTRLVARQRGCCFYCGESSRLEVEHVIPISRGGRHAIGNIVGACRSCNARKHAKLIMEFRARLAVAA